jgi:hypothetical protein
LSFRGTLFYKLLFKLIYFNSSVFHVFQSFRLGRVVNRFGVFVALPNELSLVTNCNLFVVLGRLTGMRLRDMAAERNFFMILCCAKLAFILKALTKQLNARWSVCIIRIFLFKLGRAFDLFSLRCLFCFLESGS